jgi:hypothetical protein
MKVAYHGVHWHGVENYFTLGKPFIENLVDFRKADSLWALEVRISYQFNCYGILT